MYKIIFEKYAQEDFLDIVSYYTLQGGFLLADKVKNQIKSHIDTLKFSPNMYMNSTIEPRLKQIVVKKYPYKIYFLVNEEQKVVHILGILHTSRDHKSLFEELKFFDD